MVGGQRRVTGSAFRMFTPLSKKGHNGADSSCGPIIEELTVQSDAEEGYSTQGFRPSSSFLSRFLSWFAKLPLMRIGMPQSRCTLGMMCLGRVISVTRMKSQTFVPTLSLGPTGIFF